VVLVVWQEAFRLCRRFRVGDGVAVILSSAVAICGVSAAIAACGAIRGDRRPLGYTTSLALVRAVPMMILMPWAVRVLGIPELVGGAWMGGTLDTTASVTAAAAQISEPAMRLGTIVKFSQNVLMGVAAFAISVWWALRPSASSPPRWCFPSSWTRRW
ncbi:MAG TPA: putative sulfate exporter family transporter, partial [Verrucomicrobiota bacterium]|nr:putative sulfate exporter family transporter [Verrucomicrobiota bacterium]